jgi:hypothetical protein
MIYIHGDSHARHSFEGLDIPNINKFKDSITMFRIGRDNHIINFTDDENSPDSVFLFVYGEIDCRCHIYRQIQLGKTTDDIITEIVKKYIETIHKNVRIYKKIIVVAVIPPQRKDMYEAKHGPITHEFPFLGSDSERVHITEILNSKLELVCNQYGYTFFNPYDSYKNQDGSLKYELSDTICHVGDNSLVLSKLKVILNK